MCRLCCSSCPCEKRCGPRVVPAAHAATPQSALRTLALPLPGRCTPAPMSPPWLQGHDLRHDGSHQRRHVFLGAAALAGAVDELHDGIHRREEGVAGAQALQGRPAQAWNLSRLDGPASGSTSTWRAACRSTPSTQRLQSQPCAAHLTRGLSISMAPVMPQPPVSLSQAVKASSTCSRTRGSGAARHPASTCSACGVYATISSMTARRRSGRTAGW